MKVAELFEDHAESIRKDGQLKNRLKVLDDNIEMFSKPLYADNAGVQKRVAGFKAGKELLKKFYDGEIEYKEVPYEIWELTSAMPDWGRRGT